MEGVSLTPSIWALKVSGVRMTLCDDPGAPQAQSNNDHDNYCPCGAPRSMCYVKKYLGVEIGCASVSASWTLKAFFFEENGIFFKNKLCVLYSKFDNKYYKLYSSIDNIEMISRDLFLTLPVCFYFFAIFSNILQDCLGKSPPLGGKESGTDSYRVCERDFSLE